jgi:7,8-dihydropterin-6-yl-methyl-4-(beta-D-ribofuranosyl)aminobenzene 5'-phosphate synthase
MKLLDIDGISITLIIDNYTDRLIPSSDIAQRTPMVRDGKVLPAPIAEHGFSAVVQIEIGGRKRRILFDTGTSKDGMLQNADIFGVDLDVEAIILSHGHFDHFTGLASALERIGRPVKLIVHPDAFLKRWLLYPDGTRAALPYMDKGYLERLGAAVQENSGPTQFPSKEDPCLLITGEIPRETDYEIGFPLQHAETKNGLVHDPLVKDDQAIVASVKSKGLVIVTGCGHAGVINTINYAKEITGIRKVHAIVGGFHLSGNMYEPAIGPTLNAFGDISPQFIVPCHCTGWKAVNRIVQEFPEKFVQPTVGTTLNFYTD